MYMQQRRPVEIMLYWAGHGLHYCMRRVCIATTTKEVAGSLCGRLVHISDSLCTTTWKTASMKLPETPFGTHAVAPRAPQGRGTDKYM